MRANHRKNARHRFCGNPKFLGFRKASQRGVRKLKAQTLVGCYGTHGAYRTFSVIKT